MSNPLVLKLGSKVDLTEADRVALRRVTAATRSVEMHHDISKQGDRPEDAHLVMDGFACRYKTVADGGRQILSLLLPGDFCDLRVVPQDGMDYGVATLSPCDVVAVPRQQVEDLALKHPSVDRALAWANLVDEAISREWLVSLGQRSADQRIAHLFCELHARLEVVGLVTEGRFGLPLTQQDLAEATGMSTVHVNRTLQALRGRELITLRSKVLHIPDVERLAAFAGFDPGYLHLESPAKAA